MRLRSPRPVETYLKPEHVDRPQCMDKRIQATTKHGAPKQLDPNATMYRRGQAAMPCSTRKMGHVFRPMQMSRCSHQQE